MVNLPYNKQIVYNLWELALPFIMLLVFNNVICIPGFQRLVIKNAYAIFQHLLET